MEDPQIVELYLSRDEAAIRQTAAKYGAPLRQIACRILEDAASAEECENDAYLAAWNSIPPHAPRTYLFPFLGRIVRHLAIDRCRRETGRKGQARFCQLTREMEECLPGRNNVEESMDAAALRQSIDRFLEKCPADQRNVFLRRYWFFDSIKEICERYGFSQSKVKTMLFRMRKSLREALEKEGHTL